MYECMWMIMRCSNWRDSIDGGGGGGDENCVGWGAGECYDSRGIEVDFCCSIDGERDGGCQRGNDSDVCAERCGHCDGGGCSRKRGAQNGRVDLAQHIRKSMDLGSSDTDRLCIYVYIPQIYLGP